MLIDVKNLYKIYNEGKENEVRALDGIDLQIDRGEFVAIIGASGSGKSTLMNVLGLLDIPTYGEYHLDGTDVTTLTDKQQAHMRNKQIGFIFQGYNLIPALSAAENVELPLIYQGMGIDNREVRVEEALQKVAMFDRADHKPAEMSGGQQQRVAAARAMVTRPALILADEPTGALDSKSTQMLLGQLAQLNRQAGATILVVTHDAFTASWCQRILFLRDGALYQELHRDGADRRTFFRQILTVMSDLGGDDSDVL